MNKTGIIIQARSGSSRLPNKIVLPFFKSYSILDILLQRLLKVISNQIIIVATTKSSQDDIIVQKCKEYDIKSFRGSENNVLNRFIECAEYFHFDNVIRICSDNPFIDSESIVNLLNIISSDSEKYDYISYITKEGVPSIKTHYGLWGEATTVGTLKKVDQLTKEPIYHEHVTNYIYEHSEYFKIKFIPIPDVVSQNKKIRLTIDTIEDFIILQKIYSLMINNYADINLENIYKILEENPDFYNIMQIQINNNSK
jgi:spore coat polysaccharide biosynthesis protein SpsF (cytidylyltransferase family)